MSAVDASARNGSGWSPELLTVLGAVLAVGVGLGALLFTGLDHVRQGIQVVRADMHTMEARLRVEMHTIEKRLREDMQSMEARLREDTRELRGDVGQIRERVSNLEGRLTEGGAPPVSLRVSL